MDEIDFETISDSVLDHQAKLGQIRLDNEERYGTPLLLRGSVDPEGLDALIDAQMSGMKLDERALLRQYAALLYAADRFVTLLQDNVGDNEEWPFHTMLKVHVDSDRAGGVVAGNFCAALRRLSCATKLLTDT